MSPEGNGIPFIPLDPTKWAEPKETFFGKLVICHYETTDDAKDKDGRTFTEVRNWPRPGQVWKVQVQRLDAVFVNKVTGEESPITRYQSIDLERYDERKREMVAVMQGNNKANFVIGKWLEAKVPLAPDPSKNQGMIAEWEFLRSKSFGGNIAKNMLYPIKVLALPGKDFEFRGDVERVEFDPARNEGDLEGIAQAIDNSNAPTPSAKGSGSGMLDEAGIDALLVGLVADDEDALMKVVGDHKSSIPSEHKKALLGGEYLEKALEAGRFVIVDGAFAKA